MEEIICNLHIHSIYSDGSGDYSQITADALKSGVNVLIITDHNVRVKGVDRYVELDGKRTLLLTGEEVHDQDRIPQKNHMLVIGCDQEVAQYASDPQELINRVKNLHGLTFLAHPYENALPMFHETDITWESWEISGFTGLELWNGFSEFKTVVHTLPQALFYAFFPRRIPHMPLPQTLAKWDELLSMGYRVVAVAGADSHALHYDYGLVHKVVFPYQYHFSTINNHLLLSEPLSGDLIKDRSLVYQALAKGSSFIGYDLAASTRGFSFTAENEDAKVNQGDELIINAGATLRINLPQRAEIHLIYNGTPIIKLFNRDHLVKTIDQPGSYRVEVYTHYLGKRRGWIFSNPIYIKKYPRHMRLF